jgi:hypothetical protein
MSSLPFWSNDLTNKLVQYAEKIKPGNQQTNKKARTRLRDIKQQENAGDFHLLALSITLQEQVNLSSDAS